jgi:hypothetical protein
MADKDKDKEEKKPISDLSDDELMAAVKEVVGADKVAKIGKMSPIVKTALEQRSKRSRN